jgi:hypothetical protein
MRSLLTNLADELLVQNITEPSPVLGAFSGDDLQARNGLNVQRSNASASKWRIMEGRNS